MFRICFLFLSLIILAIPGLNAQESKEAGNGDFQTALQADWEEVFFDPGTDDWQERWFLDGVRGWVKNTPGGMVLSAGPVSGDDGSHVVLWTREEFEGDIKIEFDYTRVDDIDGMVNILYIQARGKGEAPYVNDISQWSELRLVPHMRSYFRNMDLLHISFAAFTIREEVRTDYVRARRYPVKEGQKFGTDTRIAPDYYGTGLFLPGVTYHFTVIKRGEMLFFQVKNEEISKLFQWNTSAFDPVHAGRIGIRHMYTRAARYANFQISLTKR